MDALTYGNLKISNTAGTVNACSTAFIVNGNVTVASGANFTAGAGTITVGNGTSTNTISNSGTLTFNNLTVASGANVTVTGNFTSTGTTTVNGKLYGGTNTITGSMVVNGTLAAGTSTSPGLLTLAGNLTLNSGSTIASVVNGTANGTGFSQIALSSGTLTVGGNLTANITPSGIAGGTYTLINTGNTISGTANWTTSPNNYSAMNLSTANSTDNKSIVLTIALATTTTTVTSSAPTSAFGQPVTYTATVTAGGFGISGGTVTFTDSATTLGTAPLSSGTATFSPGTGNLTVGTHSITAVYGGGGGFPGSQGSFTQTVTMATTSTTLFASPNPVVDGSTVTFTATVTVNSASTMTGTVTFLQGSTLLGTSPFSGANGTTASLQVTAGPTLLEPAGTTYDITAVYNNTDSTDFQGSTSAAYTQTVKQLTSASVVSSSATATYGDSVTFTATVTVTSVSKDGHTPAGIVTFMDNGSSIGTGTLSGTSTDTATMSISTLNVPGSVHQITAVYGGDSLSVGTTSAAYPQTISKAGTSTSVTASPNPSALPWRRDLHGDREQHQQQCDGDERHGDLRRRRQLHRHGTVGAGGKATLSLTSLTGALGTHSITAFYSGDGNFAVSNNTAAPWLQTVSQAQIVHDGVFLVQSRGVWEWHYQRDLHGHRERKCLGHNDGDSHIPGGRQYFGDQRPVGTGRDHGNLHIFDQFAGKGRRRLCGHRRLQQQRRVRRRQHVGSLYPDRLARDHHFGHIGFEQSVHLRRQRHLHGHRHGHQHPQQRADAERDRDFQG